MDPCPKLLAQAFVPAPSVQMGLETPPACLSLGRRNLILGSDSAGNPSQQRRMQVHFSGSFCYQELRPQAVAAEDDRVITATSGALRAAYNGSHIPFLGSCPVEMTSCRQARVQAT